MSRQKNKRRREKDRERKKAATIPTVERPRPPTPEEIKAEHERRKLVAIADLTAQIETEGEIYRQLFEVKCEDYVHLRRVHLSGQRVWDLRASLAYVQGDHDGARKAATTSNEHARHAARLERDSLSDRVTALEQQLGVSQALNDELEAV